MKHSDVKITLREGENKSWFGWIYEKDPKDGKFKIARSIIGTEKDSQYGPSIAVIEEAREGASKEKFIPAGQPELPEIGEMYGFFGIKDRKKKGTDEPYQVIQNRCFKYEGLCIPVQGYVYLDQDDKRCCIMKFDNYYFDNQKEHWEKKEKEGKLKYILDNTPGSKPPTPEPSDAPF